jgi:hypothetical protein
MEIQFVKQRIIEEILDAVDIDTQDEDDQPLDVTPA